LVHFKLLSHVKSVPQRTGGVEIGLAPIQTVLDASISIFMFLTPSSCPLDHFGLFQVATLPKMSAPMQWWCSFSTIMHTGGPIERPLPCLLKFFAYSNSPLTKMDTFKAHLYVIQVSQDDGSVDFYFVCLRRPQGFWKPGTHSSNIYKSISL
jgi:hypothetical protein